LEECKTEGTSQPIGFYLKGKDTEPRQFTEDTGFWLNEMPEKVVKFKSILSALLNTENELLLLW
jgi:hypothetical protein